MILLSASPTSGPVFDTFSNAPNEHPSLSGSVSLEGTTATILKTIAIKYFVSSSPNVIQRLVFASLSFLSLLWFNTVLTFLGTGQKVRTIQKHVYTYICVCLCDSKIVHDVFNPSIKQLFSLKRFDLFVEQGANMFSSYFKLKFLQSPC